MNAIHYMMGSVDSASSKPSLRQRLREATAEAMLDAAEATMIERGYEKATMQEVAEAAGCATGTFYLYFKNKEVLLQAILARHSAAMFQRMRQAFEGEGNPLDRVRAGVAEIVAYAMEHKPFFRMFFTVVPLRHREMQAYLQPPTRDDQIDCARMELDLLREAQEQGALRRDLPAELLQIFLIEGGFAITEHFIFNDEPRSPEQVMETLWGLITGGLVGSGPVRREQ